MYQGDRLDQGLKLIMDLKGVGGHLEHDRVSLCEMLLTPAGKLGGSTAVWAKYEPLLDIDPNGNEMMRVTVQANGAVGSARPGASGRA